MGYMGRCNANMSMKELIDQTHNKTAAQSLTLMKARDNANIIGN